MDPPAGPVGGHPRRFFLSRTPEEGEAELSPGEAGHALRVLRLGPGDEILGLDGRGRAWPLRIASTTGKRLSLVPAGPALVEPAPGEPGAPLPRIEVACPLPRAGRAEAMLDRLVQLGLTVLTPLVSERTAPGARRLAPNRLRRLDRVIAEACKQSRRAWRPKLSEPSTLAGLLEARPGAAVGLADPAAPADLAGWIRDLWGEGRARPVLLIVGPEGGFSPDELGVLDAAGAFRFGLGPHVLRIETAAEAALGCVVQGWLSAGQVPPGGEGGAG